MFYKVEEETLLSSYKCGLKIIGLVSIILFSKVQAMEKDWSMDACSLDSAEQFTHQEFVPDSWFASTVASEAELQSEVNSIESDDGVYSPRLVPTLISMGALAQENSNHTQAAQNYERALYIVRANNGLYSTQQLPILDRMIESNTASGNWKSVANSYDMMSWLYKRNFSETDPRQLKNLKRIRRWYMEAYNKDIDRSLEVLFQSAEEIYDRGIKIMWECTNGDSAKSLCLWHKSCCSSGDDRQGVCPLDVKLQR